MGPRPSPAGLLSGFGGQPRGQRPVSASRSESVSTPQIQSTVTLARGEGGGNPSGLEPPFPTQMLPPEAPGHLPRDALLGVT